jgi:predicted DsbA family dithiol-disulfide isomerase
MEAIVWSDYLCPWAYLGRDRTALLRSLGIEVTPLPYDLHPEMPATGRDVRPGGRLHAVLERIAAECEEVGLPFEPPAHIPHTRRALETAEVVRREAPEAFAALDDALFAAVFVGGHDIGVPEVLDEVVASVGVDAVEVRRQVDAGLGRDAVDASVAEAHTHGATGTPSWLLGGKLLVPGVQPRETIERWARKLLLA